MHDPANPELLLKFDKLTKLTMSHWTHLKPVFDARPKFLFHVTPFGESGNPRLYTINPACPAGDLLSPKGTIEHQSLVSII